MRCRDLESKKVLGRIRWDVGTDLVFSNVITCGYTRPNVAKYWDIHCDYLSQSPTPRGVA